MATLQDTRQWLAHALAPYIASGGMPRVPASSTILAPFATTGYLRAGGDRLHGVEQPASSITLPTTDGTYWLALHWAISGAIGSWTRVGTTHYLYMESSTQPALPPDGLIFAEVTVASTIISAVRLLPVRSPIVGRTGTTLYASDFGFSPSASGVDNQYALQAVADAQQRATVQSQPAGGTFRGSAPQVVIDPGEYDVTGTVTWVSLYANVYSFGKAILNQTDGQALTFDFPGGYTIVLHGVKITGGARGISFWNPNLNASTLRVEDCEFQDVDDFAVYSIGSFGIDNPLVSTTLTAEASGGQTAITVASITGLADQSQIVFQNDQGHFHWSTINGTPSGNTVTLDYPIPAYWTGAHVGSSGNLVTSGDFHTSNTTMFANTRFIGNRRILLNAADRVNWYGENWLDLDSTRQDSNSAQIVNVSGVHSGTGFFGVPQRGSNTGLRWFDLHAPSVIDLISPRFGGEDGGGLAIAWNYARPNETFPYVDVGGAVRIRGGAIRFGPGGSAEGEACIVYNYKHRIQQVFIDGAHGLVNNGEAIYIVDNSSITYPTYNVNTPFSVRITPNMAQIDDLYSHLIPDFYVPWQAPMQSPLYLGSLETKQPSARTDTTALASKDINGAGTQGLIILDEQNTPYVFGGKGQGQVYPTTGTSGQDSIIDTGLFLVDVGDYALFDLMVVGNPNVGGSAAYRDVFEGRIAITTGNNAGVVSAIQLLITANPTPPGIPVLTVAAVLWDGATETTEAAPLAAGTQIRIKVTYTGTPGVSQVVRLQRRL